MDQFRPCYAWIGYHKMVLLHGLASDAELQNRVHMLGAQVMVSGMPPNEIAALGGAVTHLWTNTQHP